MTPLPPLHDSFDDDRRPAARPNALPIAMRLSWVRAGLAAGPVLFPGLADRRLIGENPGHHTRTAVRVLAARHLAQAAATALRPTNAVLSLGVAADATHALSMVAVGVCSRRWRRGAVVDAGIAAGFAAVGLLALLNETNGGRGA